MSICSRAKSLVVAPLILPLLVACTTTSNQEEQRSVALLDSFSRDAQELGSPTDGVTLRAIRTETHEAFVRFVFELEGEILPATTARLLPDAPVVEVLIHGVRMDETGNRPLVNEMGEPFGSPVGVNIPPVVDYGRKLVLDDSLIGYEIRLARPTAFRLHAEGTSLVIVDIAKAE